MKNLKKLLFLGLLSLSNLAFSQSDCDKTKKDLAQIISGSYKCEIRELGYGGDGSYKNSQVTVTISKVGENKIKISSGSNSYTISGLAVNGSTTILGEEPAEDNNGSKSLSISLYEKKANVIGQSSNGTSEKAKIYWSFDGISIDNNKPENLDSKFVAQNVTQLDCHLKNLKTEIAASSYQGSVFRALNKKYIVNGTEGKPLTIFSGTENLWQRYDLRGQKALYFSQTLDGNETEISYYGDWKKSYQVWQFDNIEIDNLLDLTDSSNLEILGLTLELLNTGLDSKYDRAPENDKTYNYEFTNSVSTWASNKYKGLIVPGARGSKNYTNIVLFRQSDIDAFFVNKKGVILH